MVYYEGLVTNIGHYGAYDINVTDNFFKNTFNGTGKAKAKIIEFLVLFYNGTEVLNLTANPELYEKFFSDEGYYITFLATNQTITFNCC